ncbi:MAG: hypothetical protein A2020_02575 [Lentisphaerae bacterium GWF2_45_14]|nr:MAG: hypothetical protein A2020_02575 [Lentisphaerae bacterium GWF2_45_14]
MNSPKIIDCSVWHGQWFLYDLRYSDLVLMEKKLRALNVQNAFISPLESVFAQDPHEGNFKMLEDIKDRPFFQPAPVIDLLLANWKENIEKLYNDLKIKMIRLIPNFHTYELTEESLEELVQFTAPRNIIIAIPMRMEDSRGQSPLLKEPMELPIAGVAKALSFYPQQKFILNNVYWHEVNDLYHILGNTLFDIAMMEPVNPLKAIKEKYSIERFVFSSNCPFFYPEGNWNKLSYSDISEEDILKIASENIEKLI